MAWLDAAAVQPVLRVPGAPQVPCTPFQPQFSAFKAKLRCLASWDGLGGTLGCDGDTGAAVPSALCSELCAGSPGSVLSPLPSQHLWGGVRGDPRVAAPTRLPWGWQGPPGERPALCSSQMAAWKNTRRCCGFFFFFLHAIIFKAIFHLF